MATPAAGTTAPRPTKVAIRLSKGAATGSSDGGSSGSTSESSAGDTKEAKDDTANSSKVSGGQVLKIFLICHFKISLIYYYMYYWPGPASSVEERSLLNFRSQQARDFFAWNFIFH